MRARAGKEEWMSEAGVEGEKGGRVPEARAKNRGSGSGKVLKPLDRGLGGGDHPWGRVGEGGKGGG